MTAQLKTDRVVGSDPGYRLDDAHRELEADLATILGITQDEDVVPSCALGNDGKTFTVEKHLAGAGSTPAIAAGAGAGSSPTITISGTDLCGEIILTTGAAPTGSNAIVCTVTFATPFAAAPRVLLSPSNGNAASSAQALGVSAPSSQFTTASFKIVTGNGATGLDAATQYKWVYAVIGA